MNVRELVTVLKFKTDTATMKSAEASVNRIKDTMARIKPATLKVNTSEATNQIASLQQRMNSLKFNINTSGASKQIDSLQAKINSLKSKRAVKVNMNMGGAEKRIDALNRKLDRLTGQKSLRVSADTTGIDNAIGKLNELDRTNQRVTRNFFRSKTQGIAEGRSTKPQKSETSSPMMSLGGLKGVFMALGGMAIVNEIKQTADAMMSLSSRIKLVTKDDAERLQIESRLYQMSNRNRASLEDLGDLYYKTASASKQFGASQEDVLRLTDIVSKSLIIGGADTNQQKSTILQLSQALSSGVLQGDELRSLRENAPRLMQEIAKNMGTTMAGLKEMGAKGELTTQKLMQAILQSGGAIEGEFARMTPTIGQALTVLGNKWSKLILDIQNNTGVFGAIAGLILEGVDLIGKAIDWVVAEFGTATPEMMGMLEDFKNLWKSLQPLISALGTIFMNIVVPALKMFGRVASAVLGMVATLLQPIADLLGRIAGLIATASNGFSGLISKAESGAIERYNNIRMSQNNTFNLSNEAQLQPAMESANEFYGND